MFFQVEIAYYNKRNPAHVVPEHDGPLAYVRDARTAWRNALLARNELHFFVARKVMTFFFHAV